MDSFVFTYIATVAAVSMGVVVIYAVAGFICDWFDK